MTVTLGAGWTIHHLTDRVIELRKDDIAYRRYLGRDGFVRHRAEPGTDRQTMVQDALALAQRNDEMLAARMAADLVPRRLGGYQMQLRQFAPVFGTPEDPDVIGVKNA